MENLQNVDPWVWVAVAVGVVAVIGLIAALASRKKRDWDHTRAEAMRNKVEQELPDLRGREASALEAEAQAERARADAERLEAQARERRTEADEQRSTLNERLREADERDPLVNTDSGEHRHADSPRRD
jgi:biopolymer transport protein ExbB/TolQ